MINILLQFFGGRGGGGSGGARGGRAGGGGGSVESRESAIKNNSVFPAGTYEYDGDEFKIGYKVRSGHKIYQTSDGRVTDDSHVQVLVEGSGAGKYRAVNSYGVSKTTGSAAEAARWAFGTPADQELTRVKR